MAALRGPPHDEMAGLSPPHVPAEGGSSVNASAAVRIVNGSFSWSAARADERAGAAQQRELALLELREVAVQIRVRGIRCQSAPRLLDRLIDRGQIGLDDPDGLRVEVRSSRVQRSLEIRDRLVVLRIGER